MKITMHPSETRGAAEETELFMEVWTGAGSLQPGARRLVDSGQARIEGDGSLTILPTAFANEQHAAVGDLLAWNDEGMGGRPMALGLDDVMKGTKRVDASLEERDLVRDAARQLLKRVAEEKLIHDPDDLLGLGLKEPSDAKWVVTPYEGHPELPLIVTPEQLENGMLSRAMPLAEITGLDYKTVAAAKGLMTNTERPDPRTSEIEAFVFHSADSVTFGVRADGYTLPVAAGGPGTGGNTLLITPDYVDVLGVLTDDMNQRIRIAEEHGDAAAMLRLEATSPYVEAALALKTNEKAMEGGLPTVSQARIQALPFCLDVANTYKALYGGLHDQSFVPLLNMALCAEHPIDIHNTVKYPRPGTRVRSVLFYNDKDHNTVAAAVRGPRGLTLPSPLGNQNVTINMHEADAARQSLPGYDDQQPAPDRYTQLLRRDKAGLILNTCTKFPEAWVNLQRTGRAPEALDILMDAEEPQDEALAAEGCFWKEHYGPQSESLRLWGHAGKVVAVLDYDQETDIQTVLLPGMRKPVMTEGRHVDTALFCQFAEAAEKSMIQGNMSPRSMESLIHHTLTRIGVPVEDVDVASQRDAVERGPVVEERG